MHDLARRDKSRQPVSDLIYQRACSPQAKRRCEIGLQFVQPKTKGRVWFADKSEHLKLKLSFRTADNEESIEGREVLQTEVFIELCVCCCEEEEEEAMKIFLVCGVASDAERNQAMLLFRELSARGNEVTLLGKLY